MFTNGARVLSKASPGDMAGDGTPVRVYGPENMRVLMITLTTIRRFESLTTVCREGLGRHSEYPEQGA
jgi:hypothetical protein